MIFLSYSYHNSVLLINSFKLSWFYQRDWSLENKFTSFPYYCRMFLRCGPMAKIQRHIQNPAKRPWWIFSLKNWQPLSFLRKVSSKMFEMFESFQYSPGISLFCLYYLRSVCDSDMFKGFYQRFEWIPEFRKVGRLLNFIKGFQLIFSLFFKKCLRPGFYFFIFFCFFVSTFI